MTLIHKYNGSVVTQGVELTSERGFSTSAYLGNPEIVSVAVDDPDGSLDFTGYKSWEMIEDACASGDQTVWYGYVHRQRISRGGDGVVFPAGRVWNLELRECNTLLVRRLLTADEGAKRDAESVGTRVTWLLTTAGFSGIIADYGNVVSSSTTLDATDYTNRTGADVLQECALRTGFNYYVRRREASSDFELFFYHATSSGLDASALQVSNVATDVDYAVVWPPSEDSELECDPTRIASTVAVATSDPDNTAYATDAGTASAFAAVDLLAPDAEIATAANAQDLADHLLAQHDSQEELVTTRIQVPAANLNDVKAGQLITARFSHFPSWTTASQCRVRDKSFGRPPNKTQAFYDVALTLSPVTVAEAVATDARLTRPSADDYLGAGVYLLDWDHDGDNPQSGDAAHPLTGLIEYVGSTGSRRILRVLGAGTVTIVLSFSVITVVNGDHTFTARILVNGAEVAQTSQPTSGGLRFQVWEIGGASVGTDLVASGVTVASGDEISASLETSSGTTVSAIPWNVGNGGHQLRVYGNLAA